MGQRDSLHAAAAATHMAALVHATRAESLKRGVHVALVFQSSGAGLPVRHVRRRQLRRRPLGRHGRGHRPAGVSMGTHRRPVPEGRVRHRPWRRRPGLGFGADRESAEARWVQHVVVRARWGCHLRHGLPARAGRAAVCRPPARFDRPKPGSCASIPGIGDGPQPDGRGRTPGSCSRYRSAPDTLTFPPGSAPARPFACSTPLPTGCWWRALRACCQGGRSTSCSRAAQPRSRPHGSSCTAGSDASGAVRTFDTARAFVGRREVATHIVSSPKITGIELPAADGRPPSVSAKHGRSESTAPAADGTGLGRQERT